MDWTSWLHDDDPPFNQTYHPFEAKVRNCHAPDSSPQLTAGDWAMIAVLSLFGLLISLGTGLDLAASLLGAKAVPAKLLLAVQVRCDWSRDLRANL